MSDTIFSDQVYHQKKVNFQNFTAKISKDFLVKLIEVGINTTLKSSKILAFLV